MTRFDDIQARHAKATPGPWKATGDEWLEGPNGEDIAQGFSHDEQWDADAEFIAHCPDDVRWLLDRVTRLEAALKICADTRTEIRDRTLAARAALDTEQT